MQKYKKILDPKKAEIIDEIDKEFVMVAKSFDYLIKIIDNLDKRMKELENLVLNSQKLTKIPTEDIAE